MGHVLFEMPSIRPYVRLEIKSGDPEDRDGDAKCASCQHIDVIWNYKTY